jgi:uncharacterized membrane protein YphA (DoxX/SURF4 family)
VRRLFSTFAHGWPGAGLLLLRLAAGVALIDRGVTNLWGGLPTGPAVVHVVATGAGILLFAGLWTPVAGVLVAAIELWNSFSQPGDGWFHMLLASLGAALALLGPGAWSVDARLFGWKRLDIRTRKR